LPDDRPDGSLASLNAWLRSKFSPGSATNAQEALAAALRIERRGLSIVFVSDGELSTAETLDAIKAGQQHREKAGLGQATIMIWGAGRNVQHRASLRELAKICTGGLWIHRAGRGPW
jgi:hypothetical protein